MGFFFQEYWKIGHRVGSSLQAQQKYVNNENSRQSSVTYHGVSDGWQSMEVQYFVMILIANEIVQGSY